PIIVLRKNGLKKEREHMVHNILYFYILICLAIIVFNIHYILRQRLDKLSWLRIRKKDINIK
ncbi:hypothetical protein, partial [Streptococcus agalactiae]